MLTLLLCLSTQALGADSDTEYRSAVLVSPIGPTVALVASAAGTPAFDLNVKAHHMLGDRVGLTLQTDFLRVRVEDVHVVHTGLKAGPRFALRGRGLSDWTLTPFASVGYTSVSAAHEHLVHYEVLGLGLDAGRTWVWKRFAMDLGLGVYSAFPVGFQTGAEALEAQAPISVSPIKPSVTWSIGYAF